MDRVLGEQHHFFSMKDINVKQYVLIVSFYCENGMGVPAKTIGRLKRRSYNLKIPNQLWHIDANQKLSRWYIIIFIADTILYFLSKRCANLLFFWCVRRDQCMKNVVVLGFMI